MMNKEYDFIPLCWLDRQRLLVCNSNSVLLVHSIFTDSLEEVGEMPLPFLKRFFRHFTLTARAMRLVNFTSCLLEENLVLVAFNSVLYLVDVEKKEIRTVFNIDKGKRPLFFCNVNEGYNAKAGIYYGDYCSNADKKPINVYRVDKKTFEKKKVFTFAEGMVNHVHNVVFDNERDCIWIFTGDFGDGAAIFKTSDNFKTVECILSGSQDYRADVVTIYDGDIWYATDTPFAPNHLMRLYHKNGRWLVEKVEPLDGPVIYGGRMGNYLIFSTDVESDGVYKSRWDAYTSRKLGKGIKDDNATLYSFNLNTKELKNIYRCQKDSLPFVIFQFGAIMFPDGECDGSIIPAFHVALKEHQLKTLMIVNNGN